jgi:anti-sigma regulatory factor (Ser/Thr protein kinase)
MSSAGPHGPTEIRLRLDPHPSACAEARHAVRDLCRDAALDHVCVNAELLTSELVANAVRHATSLVTVLAVTEGDTLTVTVGDDGPDAGPIRPVATEQNPEAESGRGLLLVDTLAERWGSTQQEAERRVWFRLV